MELYHSAVNIMDLFIYLLDKQLYKTELKVFLLIKVTRIVTFQNLNILLETATLDNNNKSFKKDKNRLYLTLIKRGQ